MSNDRNHLRLLFRVFVLGVSLALAGNIAHAAETRNRLAANKLAANRLAANRLAANRLAANALSSTKLVALQETADLLQTAEGREVYSYIISCALPSGTTIEADVEGAADTETETYSCLSEHCTFRGVVGLAEYWIDHRLAPRDQRWVSACLFARVNVHDYAEAISLRGPHDSLTVGVDEAELFTLEEGAFYGNVFTDEGEPIDWNACEGASQAAGESGGLAFRDCTEEDPDNPGQTYCGFNYAGDCADFSPEFPSPYACESFDTGAGVYDDCHAESADGHWQGAKKYREAITVYVGP